MFNTNRPATERHLPALYDMLTINTEEFAENLEAASSSNLANGALASAANTIISTAGNELSGVLNTARNCLSFAKCPYNRKSLEKSSIKHKDFFTDSNDFYICTDLTIDNKPNKLTQFLSSYIFNAIRNDRKQTSKKDRLMVLDELPSLGYLGFVSQALTLAAGYGVKILGVFQTIEKIQTTYPDDWRTFLQSSLAIFLNAESDAAEYISNRLGKTTINLESESTGTSQQSKQGEIQQNTSQQSGTTKSDNERSLLTQSEISSFGKDVIVAFLNGQCPPIICRRINYYEDNHYKGKFDDNPLHK